MSEGAPDVVIIEPVIVVEPENSEGKPHQVPGTGPTTKEAELTHAVLRNIQILQSGSGYGAFISDSDPNNFLRIRNKFANLFGFGSSRIRIRMQIKNQP